MQSARLSSIQKKPGAQMPAVKQPLDRSNDKRIRTRNGQELPTSNQKGEAIQIKKNLTRPNLKEKLNRTTQGMPQNNADLN